MGTFDADLVKAPWTLGEAPYDAHVFGADGFTVAEVAEHAALHRDFYAGRMGDGHWATTPGAECDRSDDETAAIAHLIITAPGMRELIEDAVPIIEAVLEDREAENGGEDEILRDLLSRMRAISEEAPHG